MLTSSRRLLTVLAQSRSLACSVANTMSTSATPLPPTLTNATINPFVLNAEYAVRGQMVIRANEFERQLKTAPGSLPFEKVIYCNIGNPQQLGQQPLTFSRQVLSLCMYPELLKNPEALKGLYAPDAIERASFYLSRISGGLGAYSHSKGIEVVREEVVKFLERRDGFGSNSEDVFLTDGASVGIQNLLTAIMRTHMDSILIPIPQYPLYTASISLRGGSFAGYYLDETRGWGTTVKELERAYSASLDLGRKPRALVVINPGNPTGQCLPEENMKSVVEFCHKHRLILVADEVYQENVYAENKKFVSFKKVVSSLGEAYKNFELASFHSVSKGFTGECGLRGGYMELHGFSEEAKAQLYKLASINLCPNLTGQVMVGLMVNPPKVGDASYNLYVKERDAIMGDLKKRAIMIRELNKIPDFSCSDVEGALYAFPRVRLSQKVIAEAEKRNVQPDFLYCMSLLEATGVCTVPGSGFKQEDGTFHFRIAILPPVSQFESVVTSIARHHAEFVARYA